MTFHVLLRGQGATVQFEIQLALQEGDREEHAPLVSWRLATAFIALVAMAVILFWVPVPFVVSSPGPTFNVLGSANAEGLIPADWATKALDAYDSDQTSDGKTAKTGVSFGWSLVEKRDRSTFSRLPTIKPSLN